MQPGFLHEQQRRQGNDAAGKPDGPHARKQSRREDDKSCDLGRTVDVLTATCDVRGSNNRHGSCEQDRRMAALLGIDVDKTISLTFVMGAALAAVAGVLFMIYYGVVSFSDGFVPGIKAFTAAVLGGIGSLPGAVLGGLLIGLIETLWSAYFSIDYKDVATFCILAITLVFLPSGLLGRPEVEKV